MRTVSVGILAAVLVYGLPAIASAQQSVEGVCPPGQVWNAWEGWCERANRGPGPLGPQPGWISGSLGYEPTVCQSKSGGGYHNCSTSLGLRPRTK